MLLVLAAAAAVETAMLLVLAAAAAVETAMLLVLAAAAAVEVAMLSHHLAPVCTAWLLDVKLSGNTLRNLQR
jgi:energy-converting hydrogenase Eha subunit C